MAAFTDQTGQSTPRLLTAGGLSALNTISLAASGFTGEFGDGGFDPKSIFAGPGVATGDFTATLSSENYTLAIAVPEPTSFAIFVLGGVCGLGYRQRRRLGA